MLRKIICLLAWSCCFAGINANDFAMVRLETEIVPVVEGQVDGIAIGRLYPAEASEYVPSKEMLLFSLRDGDISLDDKILGHTPSVEVADYNGDGVKEVAVFFFSGGNQYALNLYYIEEGRLKPFKKQPASSNMRSISIEGEQVVVKIHDHESGVSEIVYSLAADHVVETK